jgi:hypothetical protein
MIERLSNRVSQFGMRDKLNEIIDYLNELEKKEPEQEKKPKIKKEN